MGAGDAGMRIAALILAAGESRRMGYPKALLPIGNTTFVEHILQVLRAARRVDKAYLVLGAHAERIQSKIALADARVVLNERWTEGQLSSLCAGLQAVQADGEFDAILMVLVDHPLIDSRVVDAVCDRFAATGEPIVVPVHGGRRGHPVLFAARLFPELLGAPMDQGARAVVWGHAHEVGEVVVDAAGITADIDTPALYREWLPDETDAPFTGPTA
jgi:molybdenum cofactor cytidylyltransferase